MQWGQYAGLLFSGSVMAAYSYIVSVDITQGLEDGLITENDTVLKACVLI
jgi:hypothetical protein